MNWGHGGYIFCVHFIYHSKRCHCRSGVVGIENECVGWEFGTSFAAWTCRLLVLKHCSGSLLLKITHWRFLKVVQWATIVTVRGSMTGRLLKLNHIYIYIYIENYSNYSKLLTLYCRYKFNLSTICYVKYEHI